MCSFFFFKMIPEQFKIEMILCICKITKFSCFVLPMCFSLKVQQGLLVDFGAFPQKFIGLLSLCLQEEQKDVPKFIVHLVTNGNSDCSTASLNVIETNPFKHLTHLSLKFLPGMDADVKEYLADCLKNLKVCVEHVCLSSNTTEGSGRGLVVRVLDSGL